MEYLGPDTHPDLPVARAVRMAIAMPLFFDPVELDGGYWCDGGIVDIFPVVPLLDIEPVPDLVVAVNGFYPPGFAGDDASGWHDRRWSILHAASQVRTCQHVELARHNLARLRRETDVVMVDPVPYDKVRGIGFYRQFLDTGEWPAFMQAGRDATLPRSHNGGDIGAAATTCRAFCHLGTSGPSGDAQPGRPSRHGGPDPASRPTRLRLGSEPR